MAAEEPTRVPRQVRCNRKDEDFICSRTERVIGRVFEFDHAAADACHQSAAASCWDDEERMAATRGIGVALAGGVPAVERLTVASLNLLGVHTDPRAVTVSERCADVLQAAAMYGCS